MSWKEESIVSQREQFYDLAMQGNNTIVELCKLFGISRKTGYKWIKRGHEDHPDCFKDRSRAPKCSPLKTSDSTEQLIIATRKRFPKWGARKLKRYLENSGNQSVPAVSTVFQILKRNHLVEASKSTKKRIRFEHEQPNDLWQMDFKGHFKTGEGRCHPLTVLDDHSRFSLTVTACKQETKVTVQSALAAVFEQYGLPNRMTMDNGSPWGNRCYGRHTKFTVWLMDLGIKVSHSTPYNPQTQGKDERFHRTLKHELLDDRYFLNFRDCQKAFDEWRAIYNFVRPHEALELDVPGNHYQTSKRIYKGYIEPYEYYSDDNVRLADCTGEISFKNRRYKLGFAFAGKHIAVRATIVPDKFDVYYRHQKVGSMNIAKLPVKVTRSKL